MQVSLVMTVLGKDRPGLVETLARVVADHGGNWLESRMCRLGGEFAGILRVHVPADRQPALERALSTIGSQGLSVTALPDPGESSPGPRKFASLELIGQDRPGIVRQISSALAKHQVNVEDFRSECSSAPMTGESLFKAEIDMQIPNECDMIGLRKDLEKIAADLLVDISLEEWLTTSRSRAGMRS